MQLTIEIEREADGRWLAEAPALPGVLGHGQTKEEALDRARVLALRTLADRLEHGEPAAEINEMFVVKERPAARAEGQDETVPFNIRDPDGWAASFRAFIENRPKREGITLDDSRESIYAGRGE